ncbi:MAG: DUF4396 domain-containing protein [Chloroflexi bacterium]|nr:DUF4396 domain-containing protein [Chloroflexota bacterium]
MLDTVLTVWFLLTAASTAYVAYDLLARTPAMGVMKLGWTLVLLYTGPVGLALYLASCRKPGAQDHQTFVAPRWKQALGSTIHCLAGDATGIIVAGAITTAIGFPMGVDLVFEYAAGFTFGLLIFQALFRKAMRGGSYLAAVRATVLPEWLSMNALMAGMIPVMVLLMSRDMGAMEPTSIRFWGVMSLATIVGGLLAYPVNWWLVATGLKHGMGSSRALGKGGHDPAQQPEVPTASAVAQVAITSITLAMLLVGLAVAAVLGDLSMRAPR